MHVAVVFENIGGYHAARLLAAYQMCQKRGWEMTAIQITDHQGQHPWGKIESLGFPVRTVHSSPDGKRETHERLGQSGKLLKSLLDSLGPNVVAIPGWGFDYSRAALTWCRRNRARAVLMSESKQDDERRTPWKEWLKKQLFVRFFSSAVVGAKSHQQYLSKLGMKDTQIFFGYDVVDNDYFAKAAKLARDKSGMTRLQSLGIPKRPYFLAMTRLIPRKNVERLVSAFSSYRTDAKVDAPWDLVICGSGIQEKVIREVIQANGLDSFVHLPGFIPYEHVGAWYGLASAFIHPAMQEQWGLVINEACAASLPILCSRTVGAASELVREGTNGYLFDPLDTGAIAYALVKMHQLSEDERLQMGESSARIVAQFTPQHFAEGLMQAIATGSISLDASSTVSAPHSDGSVLSYDSKS